jgi:hypothetical protein
MKTRLENLKGLHQRYVIRKIELQPLFILHPTDYYKIVQNKASTADLYSLPPGVIFQPDRTLTVAAVRTIWNTSQVSGKFDVIDTSGILFVTREPSRVTFYTDSTMAANNSTFVTRNFS